MNTQNPDQHTSDNLILIAQRVGHSWRCLFASIQDDATPEIVETVLAVLVLLV